MMTQEHDPPGIPPITVGDVTVRTEVLRLADGRRLAWSEFGAPRGPVLMHCHGTSSSRVEGLVAHKAAMGGVRVIAPDRPGAGRSDPQPARSLRDWVGDIAALADHLGVQRFAISGISGADRMPSRVPRTLATASRSSPPSTHHPKRRVP
jgi:hypothetical protein